MSTNQRIDTGYAITPAVVFADHPEWPVYEAPAFWYIQTPETSELTREAAA